MRLVRVPPRCLRPCAPRKFLRLCAPRKFLHLCAPRKLLRLWQRRLPVRRQRQLQRTRCPWHLPSLQTLQVLLIQLILQNPRRGRVRRRRLLSCTPLALLPQPCPCARSISLKEIRLQRNPGKRKMLLNL